MTSQAVVIDWGDALTLPSPLQEHTPKTYYESIKKTIKAKTTVVTFQSHHTWWSSQKGPTKDTHQRVWYTIYIFKWAIKKPKKKKTPKKSSLKRKRVLCCVRGLGQERALFEAQIWIH
jgi:hypothetical protein